MSRSGSGPVGAIEGLCEIVGFCAIAGLAVRKKAINPVKTEANRNRCNSKRTPQTCFKLDLASCFETKQSTGRISDGAVFGQSVVACIAVFSIGKFSGELLKEVVEVDVRVRGRGRAAPGGCEPHPPAKKDDADPKDQRKNTGEFS